METNQTRDYKLGETIFAEGSVGETMYILVSGEVELRKKVGKVETVLKRVETPNDFFGEMALIDGRPRSASAVASKFTKLIVVDHDTFESLILGNGKFALKVFKILSERIRNSNAVIEELHELTPRERLVRGMADFAKRRGEKIFDGRLKVHAKDFTTWAGSRLGFSAEECEAQIAKLIKGELISWAPSSAKDRPPEDLLIPESVIKEHERRSEPHPPN